MFSVLISFLRSSAPKKNLRNGFFFPFPSFYLLQISLSDGGPRQWWVLLGSVRSCCTLLDNHLRIVFADRARTMEITNRRMNSFPTLSGRRHGFVRWSCSASWIGAFIKTELNSILSWAKKDGFALTPPLYGVPPIETGVVISSVQQRDKNEILYPMNKKMLFASGRANKSASANAHS